MSEHQSIWAAFNKHLNAIEPDNGILTAPMAALHAQQVESGFIRQDWEEVQRRVICHPKAGNRCLQVQFNPHRASRFNGSGRQQPPAGCAIHNDGCFLCRENILWQQSGKQIGYQIEANSNRYNALMNPFPLLPGHVVVASEEHIGQEWNLHPDGGLDPDRIIADLADLAARLPGYAGFYNGVGAGTSLPTHMHYHFLQADEQHRRFPLELEAIAARQQQPDLSCWRLTEYPLDVLHWHGNLSAVADLCSKWIRDWIAGHDNPADLTGNLIAICDEPGASVSLFFAPRSRSNGLASRQANLVGGIGGLEVLGELVLSTDKQKRLLDSGGLDYFTLHRALAGVAA